VRDDAGRQRAPSKHSANQMEVRLRAWSARSTRCDDALLARVTRSS